jgi:hypothetical protein
MGRGRAIFDGARDRGSAGCDGPFSCRPCRWTCPSELQIGEPAKSAHADAGLNGSSFHPRSARLVLMPTACGPAEAATTRPDR